MQQRVYVFAETTATPAQARIKEACADTRIEADSCHHLRRFGTHALADIRNLVGKADLHRQKRVGGVLDHLGAGQRGGHHRNLAHSGRPRQKRRSVEALLYQGLVQFPQDAQCLLLFRAEHDAVRIKRIRDGGALAQELRIAGHSKARVAHHSVRTLPDAFAHQCVYQVSAAHRYRGFVHHYAELRAVHGRADTVCGRLQITQVRLAGGQRGCAYRDEGDIAFDRRRGQNRGEIDASAHGRGFQQLLQVRFVYGHLAPPQLLDFLRVGIHARNPMAQVRQASACNCAYISCSNDGDSHLGGPVNLTC